MTNLKKLKDLATAATAGPWKAGVLVHCHEDESKDFEEHEIRFPDGDGFSRAFDLTEEDADYIAAANPAVILQLIKALDIAVPAMREAAMVDASGVCDDALDEIYDILELPGSS